MERMNCLQFPQAMTLLPRIRNTPGKAGGISYAGKALWILATPHTALVRLAICIGPPTHTGISPSPFLSHIAAIPNIYTFSFA